MVNCRISPNRKACALNFWDLGWEIKDICFTLSVSQSSLYRWQNIFVEHGNINHPPSPLVGWTCIITQAVLTAVRTIYEEEPDHYLDKLYIPCCGTQHYCLIFNTLTEPNWSWTHSQETTQIGTQKGWDFEGWMEGITEEWLHRWRNWVRVPGRDQQEWPHICTEIWKSDVWRTSWIERCLCSWGQILSFGSYHNRGLHRHMCCPQFIWLLWILQFCCWRSGMHCTLLYIFYILLMLCTASADETFPQWALSVSPQQLSYSPQQCISWPCM